MKELTLVGEKWRTVSNQLRDVEYNKPDSYFYSFLLISSIISSIRLDLGIKP